MESTTTRRARTVRLITAACAVAAATVALAGCSSGGSGAATTAASASPSSSTNAALAALTKPLAAYPVPTDPIKGVDADKGGTLYYIPITQQSPEFAVDQTGVEAAAAAVGMTVQVCDGKGTPTAISTCIDNATNAKAAGIILDAVPYDMAANSIGAAQAAGIPVVIGNQLADDRHPTTKTFTYTAVSGSAQQEALAHWVIADSSGKADVLMNVATDGHSQIQYAADGKKVFTDECPGCTVATNEVSSANFSQVPSSTASALLKNPDTNYLVVEFAQFLQASQAGVQNAGAAGKLTVATGSATLNELKAVAGGTVGAATAQASAFAGWVYVDAVLRLIAGQQIPEYTIPIRLFTKATMGDVKLTEAAQDSGEWFGPVTFTDQFKKLWGVK